MISLYKILNNKLQQYSFSLFQSLIISFILNEKLAGIKCVNQFNVNQWHLCDVVHITEKWERDLYDLSICEGTFLQSSVVDFRPVSYRWPSHLEHKNV